MNNWAAQTANKIEKSKDPMGCYTVNGELHSHTADANFLRHLVNTGVWDG